MLHKSVHPYIYIYSQAYRRGARSKQEDDTEISNVDRCVNVAAGNAAGCLGAAMSYRWCYRLAKGRMRPQPIPSFQRDVPRGRGRLQETV